MYKRKKESAMAVKQTEKEKRQKKVAVTLITWF